MSEFTVISDIGETLKKLLQDGMNVYFKEEEGNGVIVTLDSPKKIEDDSHTEAKYLSFFLYKILENADLKNRPPFSNNSDAEKPAPLTCDLHYILTAYGKDENDKLTIMGCAMQILYDTAILQGTILQDAETTPPYNLKGSSEQIKISLNPLTQETITQIWQALEVTMRLSAFYLITPVEIDSTRELEVKRVKERKLE